MTLQMKMAEIVGRCLSSVEFVHDYIQFRFDGPCLTAITSPVLSTENGRVTDGDPGYRDGLCSEIGIKVASVWVAHDELRIEFASSSAISVSLRDKDYLGPEAINYLASDGMITVA